jgi:glutamate-1-semialdehyde 2,1-aminomutase
MAIAADLKTTKSQALWERALKVLAGGVNSPVRAFRSVGGTPLFIKRAEGPFMYDQDGNRFLDFCNSWGPLILGHSHPAILAAIDKAMRDGTSFGAPCEYEVRLAEKVVSWVRGADQVRMVSSGTEAVMSAVRLARGVTGRSHIVKFSGCYHGHADYLLVAAGSGLVTFGKPSSAGVPEAFAGCTLVAPLDDEQAVEKLFADHGSDIAAVIIEPVPANNGLLLQRPEYLKKLRAITKQHGAMLIFDEVISGFRVSSAGAAGHYDITPDISTFGKVIGGGMPVGAYASSREIMKHLAPEGDVYQAGTLSGNPVAMAAGLATLEQLGQASGYDRLEALGQFWDKALGEPLLNKGISYNRIGSIFWTAFQKPPAPRTAECIEPGGAEKYAVLHRELLHRGIYWAPSAYEVGFLSLAQTEELLEGAASNILQAFDDVLGGATT